MAEEEGLSPKMRLCSLCKVVKRNDAFNRSRKKQRGSKYDYYCKECRDAVRLRSRSRLPNFIKSLHFELTKKAGKRKRDTSEIQITPDDVMDMWKRQRGVCAVTHIPLSHSSHKKTRVSQVHNTNIDRIDSQLPYTRENCHLVCSQVAVSKSGLSTGDYVDLCRRCVQVADSKKLTRRASFP